MTLEDRVQAQRLHVFRRAEELGSVTTACREAGISRSRGSAEGPSSSSSSSSVARCDPDPSYFVAAGRDRVTSGGGARQVRLSGPASTTS